MKMEYNAMVRRGWPSDGALDLAETIETGSTLSNGNWVAKQADGGVALAVTSTASTPVGLVITGNGDSASAANSGKAVVLWSNFVVDVANYDATQSYAQGSMVTVKTANPGVLTLGVVGTDPVVGWVLNVVPGSTTQTAYIRVLVK